MKLNFHKVYWVKQNVALITLLYGFVFFSQAQQYPDYYSLRTYHQVVLSDTVYFDSAMRFVPSTVFVKSGDSILKQGRDYHILTELGCFVFNPIYIGHTIDVSGRAFAPRNFEFKTFHKDPNLIEPTFAQNPFVYSTQSNNDPSDIFKQNGLNIQGNISRGVGVGNTQDLAVNSDMNLQINGKLGSEIVVEAAISDQNNPIQPEGNTQQIQDFDRVYISFSKDSSKLTVGDFPMAGNRQDYFMKFNKKSRGLQFSHVDSLWKGQNFTQASLAVSRGRFARNEIQGQEGNQGPYMLSGSNNELFIIIISGTEAVYVDGKQMQRGQQNDYVIDYNTGSLTFMPRTLITQYSRIVVEFQYADRNYGRSVFHGTDIFQKNKFTIRGSYFLEQDNKNQPFQQSLDLYDSSTSRSAIDIMTEAGNNPAMMNMPNVKKFSTFQTDRIMYRLIDTMGTKIYVYTDNPDSDSVFYQPIFSRTEQGGGNYRQKASLANGRVFEWVAPLGGVPQGNYAPLVQLTAPQRLQMFTAGVDYRPDSNTVISVEFAASNKDQNTFSTIDNSTNGGYAGNLKVVRNDNFRLNNKNKLKWQNQLSIEWADKRFNYVERYRDIEFERSWSRQYSNPSATRTQSEERILNFSGSAGVGDKVSLSYTTAMYQKMGEFNGLQFGYGLTGNHKGFALTHNTTFINSTTRKTDLYQNVFSMNNSSYVSRGSLSKTFFRKNIISAEYESEQSLFQSDTSSNFEMISYRYFQSGMTLQRNESENLSGRLNFNRRVDFLPKGNNLEQSVMSNNLSLNVVKEGQRWKDRLDFTLSYRAVENEDTMQAGNLPDRTVLSRIEYQFGLFNKSILSSTYYQIGTGQEQKREFTYIEVRQGQGTHVWHDYNENGIQEINEFETAVFQDQANFIKVLIPTNEFIRSNTNEFNQTLRISPPIKWQSANRLKKILARFNALGSYRADRKTTDNRLQTLFNPLDINIADTSLINLGSSLKGTLFFNRSNPKFGMEYNYQKNKTKQFLIQGFDSRDIEKNSLNIRMNFTADWSLISIGELGQRGFNSTFSSNRNYRFDYIEANPELFWQPGKSFRLGGFYRYYEAYNKPVYGGEKATWNEYGAEFRTFLKNLTTIDGKLSFVQINYSGTSSSPVAYDMLRGLQKGKNINWQLLVGGRIGKNIQITLNYEGRKNQTAPTVHVGRVEARYLF
ncbi:MAG: hypothetical protein LC109_06380 [Bacteroidia bacterium]|nr:hypothetical protein [Bacteroidia bacterium]